MVIRQQWELVRLPYLVGPGDQSQIIRLGSKCLHPPSHLAIPLPSVSYDIADENSHHNSSSSALLKKKRYYFSEKDIKQLIQLRIQVEPLLFSSIRLWLFRVQGESGVGFVPLPQEGLPGFRGVKSAGEHKGTIPM